MAGTTLSERIKYYLKQEVCRISSEDLLEQIVKNELPIKPEKLHDEIRMCGFLAQDGITVEKKADTSLIIKISGFNYNSLQITLKDDYFEMKEGSNFVSINKKDEKNNSTKIGIGDNEGTVDIEYSPLIKEIKPEVTVCGGRYEADPENSDLHNIQYKRSIRLLQRAYNYLKEPGILMTKIDGLLKDRENRLLDSY